MVYGVLPIIPKSYKHALKYDLCNDWDEKNELISTVSVSIIDVNCS